MSTVADRPYRRGIDATEAIAELRRGTGSQFDPAVIQVFCAELDAARLIGAETAVRAEPVLEGELA